MNWMDAHEPGAIVGRPGLSVTPPSGRGVFRAYDTSLRHQDEALGQLLDGLSDRAILNNTLVVVTSDHGEAVGASGHLHGGIVRQHQVRIPLVVSGPGVSGGVVAHPVQLADIPVWILRMVGATIPSDLDGTPLDGSGTVLVENYFGHMGVFPLLKSLLPVVVAFLLPTTDTLDHRRVGNGTHRHGLFQEPMEELPAMA